MQPKISEHTYATGRLGNPASFSRLEDALAVATGFFRSLDGYPNGTTWVYRSADVHGSNSYYRRNTCFYYFCDRHFDGETEARAELEQTGLIPIIDQVRGSIVMLTPMEASWSMMDVYCLCALHRAVGEATTEVYGAFGLNYYVAQGGGADFVHNYIAYFAEASSRCAGALLVGGTMCKRPGAVSLSSISPMPVWLVNADDFTVAQYLKLARIQTGPIGENGTKTWHQTENPAFTVVSERSDEPLCMVVKRAWEGMLKYRMRIPVNPGRNDWVDSPLCALSVRYFPEDLDLTFVAHENGQVLEGTQIRRWYEYIPNECLKNPGIKVPMILVIPGGYDEPHTHAEQCGFIKLAGDHRIFVATPEHEYIDETIFAEMDRDNSKPAMLERFVRHMLEKHPFIDPSRIYATGFSRGSINTCSLAMFRPGLFAAIAPMAGLSMVGLKTVPIGTQDIFRNPIEDAPGQPCLYPADGPDCDEQGNPVSKWVRANFRNGGRSVTYHPASTMSLAVWKDWKQTREGRLDTMLPSFILLCGQDTFFMEKQGNSVRLHLGSMSDSGDQSGPADMLNVFRLLNGLPALDKSDYDFSAHPVWGFAMENRFCEYGTDTTFTGGELVNEKGAPLLRFECAEGFEHALYTEYAERIWRFFRHYSRDTKTGAVTHDEYGVL